MNVKDKVRMKLCYHVVLNDCIFHIGFHEARKNGRTYKMVGETSMPVSLFGSIHASRSARGSFRRLVTSLARGLRSTRRDTGNPYCRVAFSIVRAVSPGRQPAFPFHISSWLVHYRRARILKSPFEYGSPPFNPGTELH